VFDAVGQCQYGVACRFSGAHTNEDYSQKIKDPDPNYKPTLNSSSMAIQVAMRKKEYNFGPSHEVNFVEFLLQETKFL
jgi:hypothetical protein